MECECPYKEDIEELKKNYNSFRTDLAILKTEVRGMSDTLKDIGQKIDSFTEDIATIKATKNPHFDSNSNDWMKSYIALLKDIIIVALMIVVGVRGGIV